MNELEIEIEKNKKNWETVRLRIPSPSHFLSNKKKLNY